MNISDLIDIDIVWYPKCVIVKSRRTTETLGQRVIDNIIEVKYNDKSKEEALVKAIELLRGE